MIKSAFDWVKEIMTNKRPWSSFTEAEHKVFNSFMINKVLSMTPEYIHIVNYVQKISHNEKEKIYLIYCDLIPKKYIFSKYIKANKKLIISELLIKISQYYECSLGEAEEYIHLLRKEGVEDILIKLGTDEKEIKKLIKELK